MVATFTLPEHHSTCQHVNMAACQHSAHPTIDMWLLTVLVALCRALDLMTVTYLRQWLLHFAAQFYVDSPTAVAI